VEDFVAGHNTSRPVGSRTAMLLLHPINLEFDHLGQVATHRLLGMRGASSRDDFAMPTFYGAVAMN
jgi:uncharacterized damage-inducible protein DinB